MTAISSPHYSTKNGPNRRQTPVLRWRHAAGGAAALAVAAIFGPQAPVASASSGLTPAATTTLVANSVSRNWLDDLLEDLNDAEEQLEGAGDAAQAMQQVGMSMASSDLGELLDGTIASINSALEHDFFIGVDFDATDPTVAPDDLMEYATDTQALAAEAHAHVMLSPSPDPQKVAEQLNTIKFLIERETPHSYRSRAGLSD